MAKQSAGLLVFRKKKNELQFFLVHPGGPFFARKDAGAWSIPKGEFDDTEDALTAAKREFKEETGFTMEGKFISLTPVKLKSGKHVHAWAVEGDVDETALVSNTFEIEWPPKSGKQKTFPEIDKAGWFNLQEAREKINSAQVALLEEVESGEWRVES
ncbi:NUDIX domain-containing protein [Pinibacter aurantiacus]|uniref:NUDIX domain-containing protein n=1 Tax=Pinibacter aurantiacus TaxID=2851599 RepID=A0A9E2W433_9BACT|nr:NUDIX domain-containing protein [Pinibacter aurantiacus]MBV4356973.1 NUDIX domain-containing protein [Pinibacter aurantiacus]